MLRNLPILESIRICSYNFRSCVEEKTAMYREMHYKILVIQEEWLVHTNESIAGENCSGSVRMLGATLLRPK